MASIWGLFSVCVLPIHAFLKWSSAQKYIMKAERFAGRPVGFLLLSRALIALMPQNKNQTRWTKWTLTWISSVWNYLPDVLGSLGIVCMSHLFFWRLQQCCLVTGASYHVLQYLSPAVPECYLCDGDETVNIRVCFKRLIEKHAHFLPCGSLWSRLLLLSLPTSLCATALLRLSW